MAQARGIRHVSAPEMRTAKGATVGVDVASAAPFGGGYILRLCDLAPYEVVLACCACGQRTEYPRGLPQRLYGVPSDMLVCNLQCRHTCPSCGRTGDCDLGILDTRKRRARYLPPAVRLVACRSRCKKQAVRPAQESLKPASQL